MPYPTTRGAGEPCARSTLRYSPTAFGTARCTRRATARALPAGFHRDGSISPCSASCARACSRYRFASVPAASGACSPTTRWAARCITNSRRCRTGTSRRSASNPSGKGRASPPRCCSRSCSAPTPPAFLAISIPTAKRTCGSIGRTASISRTTRGVARPRNSGLGHAAQAALTSRRRGAEARRRRASCS